MSFLDKLKPAKPEVFDLNDDNSRQNLKDEIKSMSEELNYSQAGSAMQNTTFFIAETFFYILIVVCILAVIFMRQIVPFDTLSIMDGNATIRRKVGINNIQDLKMAISGLYAVIAILSFVLARTFRGLRHRNIRMHAIYKMLHGLHKKI